jgi:hypothetical protein
MAKRQVFYSFHFDNDVFRVQMVRQMGVIEGNEPVSKNTWETVRGAVTLPSFDVVHSHSVTRLSLTGPRASLLRTASG